MNSDSVSSQQDLLASGGPPGLKVLQQSGDLLYVPQDWAHGALCTLAETGRDLRLAGLLSCKV